MICIQRLLFGIVSSQDIFKRAFDETFNDIPDVYCIADDVLIAARTREEHDLAVNKIIQRCQDSGFRLNPKKAKILLEEINYFGHTLSKKRLKPHMKKIQGIEQLAMPRNKRELQSLLEMFNYLGKFIPNLAAKMKDLHALIKKNAEFAWEDTHNKILETRPRSKITKHCNTLTHRKKSLLNVMRVHVYSKTARQSTSHLEA